MSKESVYAPWLTDAPHGRVTPLQFLAVALFGGLLVGFVVALMFATVKDDRAERLCYSHGYRAESHHGVMYCTALRDGTEEIIPAASLERDK